jgi:hypothetical protein
VLVAAGNDGQVRQERKVCRYAQTAVHLQSDASREIGQPLRERLMPLWLSTQQCVVNLVQQIWQL